MKRVWCFGDSFTIGFDLSISPKMTWRKDYADFKGYVPKNYVEMLSEHYGYELMNCAHDGASNYTIFEEFCKNINQIKKADVVIFGWSEVSRFRLVTSTGWHTMGMWCMDNPKVVEDITHISHHSVTEILLHRNDNLDFYLDEVHNWIKLINFQLSDNIVIHWSPIEQPGFNVENLYKFQTITTETNEVIDNLHFSETGHKELFEYIKEKYM